MWYVENNNYSLIIILPFSFQSEPGRVEDDATHFSDEERVDGETNLPLQKDPENRPVATEDDDESSSTPSVEPPTYSDISAESSSSTPSTSGSPDDSSSTDISLTDIFGRDVSFAPTLTSLPTLKFVGDNLDKEVKPSDMREDNQTQSLHYFHVYGVRDRIDLTNHDDQQPTPDISSICIDKLLPSKEDESALCANFCILISRVLKKHMPFFKEFGSGLERHIRHEYYEEMSSKSNVVH